MIFDLSPADVAVLYEVLFEANARASRATDNARLSPSIRQYEAKRAESFVRLLEKLDVAPTTVRA